MLTIVVTRWLGMGRHPGVLASIEAGDECWQRLSAAAAVAVEFQCQDELYAAPFADYTQLTATLKAEVRPTTSVCCRSTAVTRFSPS